MAVPFPISRGARRGKGTAGRAAARAWTSSAQEGCVATVRPGGEDATISYPVPADAPLGSNDARRVSARRQGPRSPRTDAGPHPAARAHVGGARDSVGRRRLSLGQRQAFSSIGALANELIDQIDQERVREVRARVDRKILEQSLPKHLFYEVLHGIRSLTAYDHSAALLDLRRRARRARGGRRTDHLAKGEGPERGAEAAADARASRTAVPPAGLRLRPRRPKLARLDGHRRDPAGGAPGLRRASQARRGRSPREGAILCAPLVTRAGLLGILKVAAMNAGAFSHHEVELVSQFLPQTAVALRNARRAESLEQRVLIAERKHAMADLARGVSHDVNNALGAVLPLVQQLREEIDQGTLDPAVAAVDLAQFERSIQVCRRIFGGMLNIARGTARNPSEVVARPCRRQRAGDLARGTRAAEGFDWSSRFPPDLPPLFAVQADVEQLLLNLVSNARDATGAGDRFAIRARSDGATIELVVEDTGCGIPQEHLAKIQEPFFTTKASGHGLGLAICRSIVAQMRGQFRIESTPGSGTRVRASFPLRCGGCDDEHGTPRGPHPGRRR